jgi:hypothetical protein
MRADCVQGASCEYGVARSSYPRGHGKSWVQRKEAKDAKKSRFKFGFREKHSTSSRGEKICCRSWVVSRSKRSFDSFGYCLTTLRMTALFMVLKTRRMGQAAFMAKRSVAKGERS